MIFILLSLCITNLQTNTIYNAGLLRMIVQGRGQARGPDIAALAAIGMAFVGNHDESRVGFSYIYSAAPLGISIK